MEATGPDDSDGLGVIYDFLGRMRAGKVFGDDGRKAMSWAIQEFEKYPELPSAGSVVFLCSGFEYDVEFRISPGRMHLFLSGCDLIWSFEAETGYFREDDTGLGSYTFLFDVDPSILDEISVEAEDIDGPGTKLYDAWERPEEPGENPKDE